MKKLFLIPAVMMFAAAPALAQSPTGSTPQNSDIGMENTVRQGAEESSTMKGSSSAKPMAPAQIENSQSDKTGATPTDENRDDIKKPTSK